jgi:GH18 family chitinase
MLKMYRLLLILLLLTACSHERPVAEKPIIGVFTVWKYPNYGLEQIPWQGISHLAIASVYPKEDGTLESSLADVFITQLVTMANANNKKVILSVGGAGEGSKAFRSIMADKNRAEFFIRNLSHYAESHKVHGVDIDWEYWTYQNELQKGGTDPIESQYLIELLKQLRLALPKTLLITADIAPGEWLGGQYQTAIQDQVDYINLMAFDFTGAWPTSKIAHHADYATFVAAIEHTLKKGFDKRKLLVGLPTYGIEFNNGENTRINHIAYKNIVEQYGQDQRVMQKGQVNNTYFDTQESFAKKSAYVVDKGLAGVFVFDLASDHAEETFSLLAAANRLIKPFAPQNSQ